MSGEPIAIVTVGATLAGLILTGQVRTETRLATLLALVGGLRELVAALEERVARIETALGIPRPDSPVPQNSWILEIASLQPPPGGGGILTRTAATAICAHAPNSR